MKKLMTMKVRKLFVSMFAILAFVGCSSEDVVNTSGNNDISYLTVKLNTTNTTGAMSTRAEDYEDGLVPENSVNSVRFYFFKKDNSAANVKVNGAGMVNYYDVPNPATDEGEDSNVERIVKATLVISTKDGNQIPESIVAVVNPDVASLGNASLSLEDLNEKIADYSSTESGFLMSNSVYADGTTKMDTVSVKGHMFPTSAASLASPVTIYVERVLAKVRLTTGLSLVEGKDYYKTRADGSEKYGNKEIFVKFLGWNVTATAKKSRLMKEINPNWGTGLFTTDIYWNYADFHRSFWAVNPSLMEYNYSDFNEDVTAANKLTSFKNDETNNPNYTYLQENASDSYNDGTNPSTPSKVIIAAQLVDKDGHAMEFAEYAGVRMTIDGLKDTYLGLVNWYKANDAGTGKVKLSAADIKLVTATTAGQASQTVAGRYKVYAQLVNKDLVVYPSNAEGATAVENPNAKLAGLGGAKVWKDGYTYYYFDIRHLNTVSTGKGQFGVVRNHVYAANINSLTGLGTPVYDPDEIIYPEHPTDDDTYISAEIKILAWRIVNQNIDLVW